MLNDKAFNLQSLEAAIPPANVKSIIEKIKIYDRLKNAIFKERKRILLDKIFLLKKSATSEYSAHKKFLITAEAKTYCKNAAEFKAQQASISRYIDEVNAFALAAQQRSHAAQDAARTSIEKSQKVLAKIR